MQILSQIIAFPFWYATPENEWANLIQPYVPKWISIRDTNAMKNYYLGESSLYNIENLKAWSIPVISWTIFIFAFMSVMIFINLIVRKQWVDREKLTYPIIQLPIEMINNSEGFFKNRIMWYGFAVSAAIDLLNGVSFLFPVIPDLYVKMTNLGQYLTFSPFNAIGWFPIAFYPFIIGLGFLIPADLSFSFWFFFLFWKSQNVILSAIGKTGGQVYGFQRYSIYISTGAFIGLCGVSLWQIRRHLIAILRNFLGSKSAIDISGEPVSYRKSIAGLLISSLTLVVFCYMAGMSLWVIILFFIIYYALCTAMTRMRAEMGVPAHDHHSGGPDIIIPEIFGTRVLGASNLTIMTYFWFFNRAHYSDVMPHQLEGFKIAERIHSDNRKLMIATFVGTFVGILGTFWAILHYAHDVGMQGRLEWFGYEPFNRLQGWLVNPREPDYWVLVSIISGSVIYVVLMIVRNQFIWWPFHPAGFVVSNSWGAHVGWFPILIGWLIKTIILRIGGIRAHSKAVPFFLGLMLGEFVVGTFWCLWGTILNAPHYTLFPYGR